MFFACSDESAVYNVMPRHLQNNSNFYEQTVMVKKKKMIILENNFIVSPSNLFL